MVPGGTDFSGAICSYLFAKTLNELNADLSYLALVGSKEIPDKFTGLNRVVFDEAAKEGVVQAEGKKIKIAKLGLRVRVRVRTMAACLVPLTYS